MSKVLSAKGISYVFLVGALLISMTAHSQCPLAIFDVPDTVCIGENFAIVNDSIASVNYAWDFCDKELSTAPTFNGVLSNDAFSLSFNITLVQQDTAWYGFLPKAAPGEIIRLDFGDDLNNVPEVNNLGNVSNILNRPEAVELIEESGSWFGLVADRDNSKILRLSFGNSLANQPTAEEISLSLINEPIEIKIVKSDSILGIVANGQNGQGSIVQLNFGNSITNTPTEKVFSVPGSDMLRGVSVFQKSCGQYFGIASSYDNGRLFLLDFDNGVFNTPAISQLSLSGVNVVNPARNFLTKQLDNYYGYVQGRKGNLYRIVLAEDLTVTNAEDLGRVDGSSASAFGYTMAKQKTKWMGFSVDFSTGKLNKVSFEESCEFVNTAFSESESPANIAYNTAGDYQISLKVTNELGYRKDTLYNIHVKNSTAPAIDFTVDNQCLANPINFNINTEESPLSVNWLINGVLKTGENVTYSFPSPDEYPILIEIETANGCGQRITKPITIYDPPEPDFLVEAPGAICSNGIVNFNNQTNTQGADSLITYNWNFSGEDSSTTTSPEYVFATGGNKTVTLTAAIPGCEASADTTFAVFEGPAVEFVFENECAGEGVQFLNQTSGSNITQYNWDFGDGNTFASATLTSPEHVFDSVGNYNVSLTVNDAQGCENEVMQTFTSFAKPEASFNAELSCAGTPTRFTDETQIDASANVVLWNWDFGDAAAATKNPEYTFASPGSYNVQLIAETNEGCADSAMQQIVVETPVQPGFETIKICPSNGLDVQLNDTSLVSGGENISQWLWHVDAESRPDAFYQTQNPVHTFPAPGEYTVSLTATASSLCNASVTRTIEVLPLPEAGFSFTQACANDAVSFTNTSANPEYIDNYHWDFGGEEVSSVANPSFAFAEAGSYPVQLLIEDIHGCTDTLTQTIEILPRPVAGFTVENTTGAAPFTVNFENTSADATHYQWDFAGLDTSLVFAPDFTFEETGTYPVQLSVANAIGCADTLERVFTVVQPVFDVSLNNLTVQETANGKSGKNIILTVSNPGTLPIEGFTALVEIDDQLSLERAFSGTLEPGATMNFTMGVAFSNPKNPQETTRYICATLAPLPQDFNEVALADNVFCLNLDDTFYSLPPFPNPVQGMAEISMILPEADPVNIAVSTTEGKILQNYTFSDLQKGLNTIQVDVSAFRTGLYLLQVSYQGHLNIYRLVINP